MNFWNSASLSGAAAHEKRSGAADGRSVPVLVPGDDGQFLLDEDALRSVLMQDGVRHLPVVVVAVAGAFRRGKSFLLSLLLRFLEHGGATDWLGAPDEPLTGFAWRGGRERHTVGIHMWSQPARVRLPSGQEVAVVLMDTQGSFDNQTAVSENATVFALSALTSSLQIYNVANQVGTDDLQHLQLFAEFGNVASQSGHGAVFQKLLFLVRDWQHPSEAPFGSEGGQLVLREILDSAPGAPNELRGMRQHLRQSFTDIDCFLMPHPGKTVATSPTFTGCPRDIDEDFLGAVDRLARLILSPERLVKKESNGEVLTAGDLVVHFKAFHDVFRSGAMPQPRSLVNTMSEANHLAGVSRASTQYAEKMRQWCSRDAPGLPEDVLDQHHQTVLQDVVAEFDSQKKMLGGADGKYRQQMLDDISTWKQQFFQANKMKNELAEAQEGLRCNQALSEARDCMRRARNDALNGARNDSGDAMRERYEQAREDALLLFDDRTTDCQRRRVVDEYRRQLLAELDDGWEEFELISNQRGQKEAEQDLTAMDQARSRYRSIMEECLNGGPINDGEFNGRQRAAEHEARELFRSQRGQTHDGTSQVDQFFDRQMRREEDSMRTANFLETAIRSLTPIISSLIIKAASKCVVM